jgi:hypothetical protein
MAKFEHEQVAGLDDRFFVTIDNRYELSINGPSSSFNPPASVS